MSRFQLSKGKQEQPEFFALFGVEGVGKTTFASKAPKPVIIDIEGGSHEIDTIRVDDDYLKTVDDIIHCINEMGDSDFETIVIDSISRFEKIVWKEVAERNNKNSIEDIGYAKGYIFALEEWERLLAACKVAHKKGKNIILLAHNFQKTFNDPTMVEGYTRYELELHHKAASLIKKNVKAIYFANYKVLVKEGRGLDTGKRCIYTERRAGHDAKNRYGLPYEIELDWDKYKEHRKNSTVSKETLIGQIEGMIPLIPSEETQKKVSEAISDKLSIQELQAYIKRVETIIGEGEDA